MAEGDIEVYGPIRAQTVEGRAAYASQIWDEAKQKFQSEINEEGGGTITYESTILTSAIPDGSITGALKTAFTNLRNEAAQRNAEVILLDGGDTYVVATIETYGSEFRMWFVEKGRYCEVTGNSDNTTWTAHWTETLESITQQEFNAIFS